MKRDKMTKNVYLQMRKMLDMVGDAIGYIMDLDEGDCQLIDSLEKDLIYTIENVNIELLYSPKVGFCRLER